MIKKILIGFALAAVIILFLVWLATGGPRKIASTAGSIGNSFNLVFWGGDSNARFRLPWQPEEILLGPDISDVDGGTNAGDQGTLEGELSRAQKEYDDLRRRAEAAETFGEPSPHRGKIALALGGAADGPVASEYIEMEVAWDNTAPVNVSGWSLQSALTGLRAYVPRGASLFIMGAVNTQENIYLNPGGSATVASGVSPVGTSFRENTCTGYLDGLQTFVPSLSHNCPAPAESMPLTPGNVRTYGDACFDFVQTLSSCDTPLSVPPNVAPACRIFLANNLSYNGCVQNYRYKSNFARDSWRIYLNAGGELWRNSHDIIRLLDDQGRTVDVVSY